VFNQDYLDPEAPPNPPKDTRGGCNLCLCVGDLGEHSKIYVSRLLHCNKPEAIVGGGFYTITAHSST